MVLNSDPPHALERTIDFVNTLDLDRHTDSISRPEGLATWLLERGLLAPGAQMPGEGDLANALRLREALRSLMLANNGSSRDSGAASELDHAARRGELGVHFAPEPAVTLAAGNRGVDGALAGVLVPVAAALGDGTWRRVKACRARDCLWAFYDRSRNHSGVWCDMAVCGNRAKVRAYRRQSGR